MGAVGCPQLLQHRGHDLRPICDIGRSGLGAAEPPPPVVMEGIGDTGVTRSLMDRETARRVGLQIEVAHGLEFGTYFGPGSKERPYAGRVVGPVVLRFGKEV